MSDFDLAEAERYLRAVFSDKFGPGRQKFEAVMAEYDRRGERIAYLDRRRAIADAGRALLRSNGADEDWAALRVALYELDGDEDE